MTTDRDLDEILAEIGREHRALGAPDKLEPLLRAETRSRKHAIGTQGVRVASAWAAVAILVVAVAAAAIAWQTGRTHQAQNQLARSVPAPQIKPAPAPPSDRVAPRQSNEPMSVKLGTPRTVRAGRRDSVPQQPTWNSLDEFVPLPVSEGLPPAAELSVVRIKLRGSDLQQYGLEAPADSVARSMLAEFVVGEDGLPRAIRILR
jgi:hypothetical protein